MHLFSTNGVHHQAKLGDGLGSLLNDGIVPEYINCKYVKVWNPHTCRNHVIVQAIKPIERGQELLVTYGRNYWYKTPQLYIHPFIHSDFMFRYFI
jgi:hypothetical protein